MSEADATAKDLKELRRARVVAGQLALGFVSLPKALERLNKLACEYADRSAALQQRLDEAVALLRRVREDGALSIRLDRDVVVFLRASDDA